MPENKKNTDTVVAGRTREKKRGLARPDGKPLTRMERAVLKVLLNKSFWGPEWTDRKLIMEIGCSSAVFYKVKGESWVRRLRFEKTLEYIEDDLPAVSKALLESAQITGREGATDRRTLLMNLRNLVGLLEDEGVQALPAAGRAVEGQAVVVDERAEIQQAITWISEARDQLQTDSITELLKHMEMLRDRAAGQEEAP